MKTQSKHTRPSRETPLEEGLRRYAPKEAGSRHVALLDFALAIFMPGRNRASSGD